MARITVTSQWQKITSNGEDVVVEGISGCDVEIGFGSVAPSSGFSVETPDSIFYKDKVYRGKTYSGLGDAWVRILPTRFPCIQTTILEYALTVSSSEEAANIIENNFYQRTSLGFIGYDANLKPWYLSKSVKDDGTVLTEYVSGDLSQSTAPPIVAKEIYKDNRFGLVLNNQNVAITLTRGEDDSVLKATAIKADGTVVDLGSSFLTSLIDLNTVELWTGIFPDD